MTNPWAQLIEPPRMQPGRAYETSARIEKRMGGRRRLKNPWGLTMAQCAVMNVLCDGGSNAAGASELGIARRTFEVHLYAIFRSMKVSNRIQAVLMWDRWVRGQDAANESTKRSAA